MAAVSVNCDPVRWYFVADDGTVTDITDDEPVVTIFDADPDVHPTLIVNMTPRRSTGPPLS